MRNLAHGDDSIAFQTVNQTNEYHQDREVVPAFEDIMDVIGSRGKFQKRLNTVFICYGTIVNVLSSQMYNFVMQTPDHWCHVPGREFTNLTLDEWKSATIPKEGGTFSKCLMYNGSALDGASEVPCQHGWEYDDTWYPLTVPSEMNWVCDDMHIVSDVMFYAQNIGAVLGLLFGYMGDMYGRRPLQLACVVMHVVSRVAMLFSASLLPLFVVAESLVVGAAGVMLESAVSVGTELTDIRNRSCVNCMAYVGIPIGLVSACLCVQMFPSWKHSLLFAVLCCLILLLFCRWFPESPRWLTCRGREEEALSVLRRVAATNGSSLPPFTLQVLHRVAKAKRDRVGYLAIFSSWNLFKNTLLVAMARSLCWMTTLALVLSVGVISVNPLVAVSAQAVAQAASVLLQHYCGTQFGRRWSSVACLALVGLLGAISVVLLTVGVPSVAMAVVVMAMQFWSSAGSAVINLQSIEVHPTCLRQITASVECTVAGVCMSLVPYIVFQGGSVDRRLPFAILSAIHLLVALSVSFLPETALQRLPESLQDAAEFGRGRPYWSWRLIAPPSYVQGQ
ncbi:solute carrier family 22 member 7-like isoform X1 [Schistocerca nitens]|uniref:solute carrier family 22 member 7-like isoform X1 n=1 Tax=Schistocerca nitens TaxID=7011 RepID=UPI002117B00C|nr:solute carrier family 22 member 7-like isoform X1 [Schistocerca nitens]